jgi:hypothetical protein
MDQILQFHRVDCGQRRLDAGHTHTEGPHWGDVGSRKKWLNGLTGAVLAKCHNSATIACCVSWAKTIVSLWLGKLVVSG